MWVITNKGFYSIVLVNDTVITPDNTVDEIFAVRTRDKNHLSTAFPNKKVFAYEYSDYQFRVYLTKGEVADFMLKAVDSIDYTNFKNSIKDYSLHEFCTRIWTLGLNLLGK